METSAQASTTSVQSTTTADATSVHTIMAHKKSCVIAPMLSRSTFNAPVNLNIYSDRDHTERNSAVDHEHVKSVLMKHKTRLRKKFKFICEGDSKIEHKTLFRQIYTGLFITEKKSRMEKECDHEVHQIERKCSTQSKHYTPINCNDIFVEIPKLRLNTGLKEKVEGAVKEEEDIRTVLTKGIAGIGKTVSVQKFIVDWAEEKANHHIDLMLVMPFRELNVVEADNFSLCKLICIFNPELKDLPKEMYEELKIVFILDGLDEFYSPLNFHQKLVSDIIELSTVDILITNLIKGILLPSSHIWITSRPVAADQIPSQHISRLTEVQGFNDLQKEEYFRKKIGDEAQANKIISHIKTSHSLYIMCHIPVFCWITATLLQQILNEDGCTEIPKTLTEMYTHFLFIQTRIKNQKYDQKEVNDPKHLMTSNKGVILKLAELAFKQLVKGKVIFSEEDLRECGIDLTEASVYSGICTEIFKEESVLYETKLYCFVHLSFQEFLAAVHVLNCYLNKNTALQFFMHDETNAEGHSEGVPLDNISLEELLKRAVNKALQSQNGHLDLFLRFLLGISLETNQKYLQGLLTVKNNNSKSIKKTIRYIQNRIRGDDDFGRKRMANMNADSSINLYLCLTEMNDQSLHRDVQNYLESSEHSEYLSPAHCSAIAYMLQISENVLDELDLKKYNTSEEGYRRLVPAVSRCKKALFAGCCLNEQSCGTVGTVLQLKNTPLKELDLSRNNLQDSGVKLLCYGLRSSYCKLELLSHPPHC